jgi:hypothetical protein
MMFGRLSFGWTCFTSRDGELIFASLRFALDLTLLLQHNMGEMEEQPKEATISDLYDRLDNLWVQYLDLLETYTAAQDAIKSRLSAGFLSLAKANFHSSGRRYGQDSYDQRAVATTRVRFEIKHERLDIETFKTVSSLESEPKDDSLSSKETSKAEEDHSSPDIAKESNEPLPAQLPTPFSTLEPETKTKSTEEQSEQKDQPDTEGSPKSKVNFKDPIRQFGILIPPALRSAQKSFSTAVLGPEALSRAVTAARGMREVEVEIRRARKMVRKAERSAVEGM